MADTKIGAMEGGDLGLTPAGTEEFWIQAADGLTDYYSSIDTSGVVFRRRGLITESTTTRTLAAGDDGQHIRCTNASGCAITIPKNATVALPVGFRTHIRQTIAGPAGLVTTALGGSPPVTLNLPTGIRPPRFMGAIAKLNANLTSKDYNTAQAAITWDGTDIKDTDAFHNPASNNTKMIIPSGLGIVLVQLQGVIGISALLTNENVGITAWKGGVAAFDGAFRLKTQTTATVNDISMATCPIPTADSDEFELAIDIQSDTSVTVQQTKSSFSLSVLEIDAQGTSAGIHTEFWIEKVATDEWDIGGVFM